VIKRFHSDGDDVQQQQQQQLPFLLFPLGQEKQKHF
jgi:hypothetical protein